MNNNQIQISPSSREVSFYEENFDAKNVHDAILQARGIKTFNHNLHYVSGSGLNTTMGNGSFFRVYPTTFSSGSYSGYPSAFPLKMPYDCKMLSIVLTFRKAAFDYNATEGQLLFELESRNHVYNGSSVYSRTLVRFGSFSGNSTGDSTHNYELFYNNTGEDGFEFISGDEFFNYSDIIGFRFVKAPSGNRRINNFTDILLTIVYEAQF